MIALQIASWQSRNNNNQRELRRKLVVINQKYMTNSRSTCSSQLFKNSKITRAFRKTHNYSLKLNKVRREKDKQTKARSKRHPLCFKQEEVLEGQILEISEHWI